MFLLFICVISPFYKSKISITLKVFVYILNDVFIDLPRELKYLISFYHVTFRKVSIWQWINHFHAHEVSADGFRLPLQTPSPSPFFTLPFRQEARTALKGFLPCSLPGGFGQWSHRTLEKRSNVKLMLEFPSILRASWYEAVVSLYWKLRLLAGSLHHRSLPPRSSNP